MYLTDGNIKYNSLMPQTASQIEYLKKKGYPVIEIDSLKLLDLAEKKY